MSTFIKAEKVVATAIGILRRDLVLPRLVWTDAKLDPTLSQGDTVTIKLPAYAPARTRALRSGAARVKDQIHQRKVNVTLETDVYKDVPITDEEMSLDIADFGGEVLNPVLAGIAETLEDEVVDVIQGATYSNVITHTTGDDPWHTVVVARARLNAARVPFAGRAIGVGSDFEAELLESDHFVKASDSGSTDTLREAMIGRVGGFDVFSVPAFAPDEAYAFHRTAYAMVQRAPAVPAGAPWGAVQAFQGLAIRTVRVFDADLVEDRFIADSWVGASAVADTGHFSGNPIDGGVFVPVLDPANPVTGHANAWENDTARVIRAVKIAVAP